MVNCVGEFSYEFPVFIESKDEENGVENVGFARSVETCDGVELRVEALDDCACRIALKAFHDDFLDVHFPSKS